LKDDGGPEINVYYSEARGSLDFANILLPSANSPVRRAIQKHQPSTQKKGVEPKIYLQWDRQGSLSLEPLGTKPIFGLV
jgi:hypothetical protein